MRSLALASAAMGVLAIGMAPATVRLTAFARAETQTSFGESRRSADASPAARRRRPDPTYMATPDTAYAAQAANRGTIKGHVKLSGKLPGNPVIRMGMDPMCARANAGKRVVQEAVAAALDGSLANVFVRLQGTFPQTPAPTEPVVIDQRGCVYVPRVVGARVGQTLQVKNSDDLLHNVHSLSAKRNTFNISEPKSGMVQSFTLKDEEVMLRIKCDVHSWMTTYVGIVSNPYFAVSNEGGTFQIANVPAGSYTILTWHERYGPLMQTVRVRAGVTTAVDFVYAGNEKPPA